MKTFSLNNRYICTEDGKTLYISSSSQNRVIGLPEFQNEEYAFDVLSTINEGIVNGIKQIVNNNDGTYSIV